MGDKAEKVIKAGTPVSPVSPNSPAKPPPKKDPPLLNIGQTIAAGSGNCYLVESMLGKGGFGEVYKVSSIKEPEKQFAMKVELNKMDNPGKNKMLRLKIEIHVFERMKTADEKVVNKTHFVKMHDKGKTKIFKFYLMDLIWLSLKEVIEITCKGVTSPSTKITIARQTIKGLEALHELGFLHRDIKAANYAVGLPPKENVIYLLDFGIARPYREQNGALRVARATVPFMGTVRYASIRSMELQDQCRKDDIEVWIYMMLEIYAPNNLFFRTYAKRPAILAAKKELMNDPVGTRAKHKLDFPIQYCEIMKMVNKMAFVDPGCTGLIERCLDEIVSKEKIDEKLPLDWVGKRPKSPERPKVVRLPEEPKKEEKMEGSRMGELKKEESKMEEIKKELKELKRDETDKKKKRERRKESKKRNHKADDEVVITMEDLLDELKEKRRRRKLEKAMDDDYWNKERDDSGSEDDYSDEEEDQPRRKGRRNSRKRRSREKHRTRDYSDRDRDRDDRDERDERDERDVKPRKRSTDRRKKSRSHHNDDDDNEKEVPRIPEQPKSDPDVEKNRKKAKEEKKEEKTPEKGSKDGLKKEDPDDNAYMVLGDIHTMEKVQDAKDKEKKEAEAKKEPGPSAIKPVETAKKANEAAKK